MRSLIIPAYNEEKRIGEVLDILVKSFSNYEIIVVDDGSKDKTKEIALSKGVKVVSYKKNKGKGFAVKKGLLHAIGDIIGFVDADKSINPLYIKKVFDESEHADMSIATRRNKNSRIIIRQPIMRVIFSLIFNLVVVRLIFGLNISDSQCGCKAMKRNVAKYLAKNMKSKGFEFDVEMLWLAKMKNYKIKEVPVVWKHEKNSTFNLLNGPKMFLSLIKIRFKR
ncbi:MAG: glycosyltransferase family 2 protein [Candidatus Aenigmarchaeota archaeon]|nr:glycosyltransferase family 2 protein [Candidatus Aenigmarchaeota archaeon]